MSKEHLETWEKILLFLYALDEARDREGVLDSAKQVMIFQRITGLPLEEIKKGLADCAQRGFIEKSEIQDETTTTKDHEQTS